METPKTDAGRLTESIMFIFWKEAVVKLTTEQYNAVYSHVLQVLNAYFASRGVK